ncbi:glycosyltransferase family 4 protein [Hymenobacter latericus]|uniref:glycosyltransferase family 4 protein n=1 Tax=Hymenobacter sp. YIM 151858-1 TaxID=2987688 RepID=UPI00222741FD|nr:glycosyltransferase family 4 protein [Hymenobacter sp. YIM 151858-1]UYZ57454.1 glycosyltransferase family 4 protein [Hymenobacter sp. YIM 151858-1]
MATIVFVGHEASRTGAPFTQLYLMQWIKQHTPHEVVLLLIWGGDLVPEFEKLGEVHILDHGKPAVTMKERALAKLDRMTQYRRKNIFRNIQKKNPAVIFANTTITLDVAVELKQLLGVKLIINVHELESVFYHYSSEEFARNTAHVDWFIPGSNAVRNFYKQFCPIPDEKIKVIYDFINANPPGTSTAVAVRAQHGIPEKAKIVGAIASLEWRKGADLFLRVAQEVLKHKPDTYFVWVGGKPSSFHFKEITRDVRLTSLTERVLFVGGKSDLRGYYEAFDVYLLTSREDPFPLVCLEAGLSGKPVICFENSGGMPEYVRNDAGIQVPYLDTQMMAEQVMYLLDHPEEAQQMGAVGRERVLQNHTIATIGPKMYEVIQACLPA